MAALSDDLARAETREEAAALFGARESVLDISLSPSGRKLLYIAPGGDSIEIVYVVDLAGDGVPKPVIAGRDPDSELRRCQWASDERMICEAHYVLTVDGVLVGATRPFRDR